MLIRVAQSRRGLTSKGNKGKKVKSRRCAGTLARKSTWRESYFLAAFHLVKSAERKSRPVGEWRVITRHEKNRGNHQTI